MILIPDGFGMAEDLVDEVGSRTGPYSSDYSYGTHSSYSFTGCSIAQLKSFSRPAWVWLKT